MMTNFSRHIAKHEKNGDKIKQELLHLCALPSVQQQYQQQLQQQYKQGYPMHAQEMYYQRMGHPPQVQYQQYMQQQMYMQHLHKNILCSRLLTYFLLLSYVLEVQNQWCCQFKTSLT